MRRMWLGRRIGSTILTFAVLVTVSGAQTTSTNALQTLKTAYDTAVAKIASDTKRQKDEALLQYGKALDLVLKVSKQKGDLDTYVEVEKEAKRFQTDKTVPTNTPHASVAAAVSTCQKQVLAAAADSDRRTVCLLRQYVTALDGLVKDLMGKDRIEEAKAAGDVKRSAEFTLAVVESKTSAPSAASATGKNTVTRNVDAAASGKTQDAGTPLSSRQPTISRGAPTLPLVHQIATRNTGGARAEALAAIRARLEAERPDDHQWQRDRLRDQEEAYDQVQALKKQRPVPDDIFKALLQKAEAERPDDYWWQRDHLRGQMDAYVQIQAFKKQRLVPDDVFNTLLQKAEIERPGDYWWQRDYLRGQMDAYKRTHDGR